MATSSFQRMISFCAGQTKKMKKKTFSATHHLGRCDATGFQGILAADDKTAAGDDARVWGDGEEGRAGGLGAVHHHGGGCQVEEDRWHQVANHLRLICDCFSLKIRVLSTW